MMRPLVKLTSSRICNISSHPACFTAGVMNFVQMSRSLRDFLFIGPVYAGRGGGGVAGLAAKVGAGVRAGVVGRFLSACHVSLQGRGIMQRDGGRGGCIDRRFWVAVGRGGLDCCRFLGLRGPKNGGTATCLVLEVQDEGLPNGIMSYGRVLELWDSA